MDTVFILRIIIALTFLITASGFPIAIVLLRRSTKLSTRKYGELLVEVEHLKVEVESLTQRVTNVERKDG